MNKLAVIALGGNALLRVDQAGTIEEQEKNTTATLENLVFLIKAGYDLVLSHGNGPQVGNILMRNDAGESQYDIPPMPLDICVADSQGGIGYMIERMLRNVLKKHNIEKEVVTLVTAVIVNDKDPAFANPTKRVGKVYTKLEADALAEKKKWIFKKSPKGDDAWRRVVPSPQPLRIVNEKVVETLARQGVITIAVGGGGIPVYYDENGDVRAAEAVIDKDLACALLAARIEADEFYVLTDVPYIYRNFNKPDQEILEFLDYKDTVRYLESGEFGEGSMAPKIRACLQFIEGGGAKAIITEAFKLEDKNYGSKITRNYDPVDSNKRIKK
ncbi:MAG: carbamate kinase [Bacteroidetes bacterium]|jgi:carbamate kinase|nr:carbamate kinase [Bacteroidota bacterium]MBT4401916.1 carbamate kinase [Bacteroidota bacterium]MBT4410388.1 carbamate kinase [Bacteroidota bacterium]MBT7092446.1 carbamate kinase [Bacteroidota bacterium]MBT7464226.1 carbamate kinase [Bacteroidota bacterium]